MNRYGLRLCLLGLLAAALLTAAQPACAQRAEPSPAVLADYRAKLELYQRARAAYDQEANAYWDAVVAKRKLRNAKRRSHETIALHDYVLTQPPVYTGPPQPVSPLPPPSPAAGAAQTRNAGRRRLPASSQRAVGLRAADA